MKGKRFLTVGLVLVTVVAVGIARNILRSRLNDPVYNGKRLSQWLYRLPDEDARQAIMAIGTNAIPMIVERVRTGEWREYSDAASALRILGQDARPAVPLVMKLTESPDRDTRFRAIRCLVSNTNIDEKTLCALLFRMSHDSDSNIQVYATMTLAIEHPEIAKEYGISEDYVKTNSFPGNRPLNPEQVNSNSNMLKSPVEVASHHMPLLTPTTGAYRKAAVRLIVEEANHVARELQLPEKLPITETDLVTFYISAPRTSKRASAFGNITTSNYVYYMTVGSKFSFLERIDLSEAVENATRQYHWPINRMDTNAAYRAGTQLLASVSMDIDALNRDCAVRVIPLIPDGEEGKYFVPVYTVYWENGTRRGSVAEIEFIEPTKTVLQLHVMKPEYILRRSLVLTNAESLLSETNAHAD